MHPIRSILLVSSRLPPASVAQVATTSGNLIGVDLRAGSTSVRVLGVYNPSKGSRVRAHNLTLERELPPALAAAPPDSHVVVAGDFNLSHPPWDDHDHRPVRLVLDLAPPARRDPPRPAFRRADPDALRAAHESAAAARPAPAALDSPLLVDEKAARNRLKAMMRRTERQWEEKEVGEVSEKTLWTMVKRQLG
ncbi:hypothetical protein JCM10449v2_001642, partial [Rhodotorula kratochvilovae]